MFNIRTDIHAANINKVAIFLTESQPLASYDFVFAGVADTFVKSDNKTTHVSKLKHCRYNRTK